MDVAGATFYSCYCISFDNVCQVDLRQSAKVGNPRKTGPNDRSKRDSSLHEPARSQEANAKKKRRLVTLGMTG
jgi:hypothetical protein